MRQSELRRLEAAARVRRFMREDERGRWRLHYFSISQQDYEQNMIFLALRERSPERRRRMQEREVPPGDYITLHRRMTDREREDWQREHREIIALGVKDAKPDWIPVMSDTPAEIDGHMHAFEHARGRVLVNGLGLGCVVAAMLTKRNPAVSHIDIVEIDPDVLALTGPYYEGDPRVTIHHSDALKFDVKGKHWDYVWHDIWTHVSNRNLDPAEAEHGIPYSALFEKYEHCATVQGAWAYEDALAMQRIYEQENAEARAMDDAFWATDFEGKLDIVIEQQLRDAIILPNGDAAYPYPKPIPQEIIDTLVTKEMRDQWRAILRKAQAAGRLERGEFNAWRDEPDPIGNPNEGLED